jgi:zinc protease
MHRFAAAVLLALVLGACASSSAPLAPPQPPAAAMLHVAPLQFTYRELGNGLRVYSMPDPATANVSVQVWYDVGSKNDPPGRSGFAHLFEHIMFKATRNMPPETLDRLTEDVGGFNNASTWDDFTNYYEVVPANHLERVLWAEAERMGSLVVDAANFASEREVVKEELRQSILAQPYGKLFGLYIAQTGFETHPYGRPTIGSIEDLDAATVEDVRAFHAAYYRPDNAVLVVAGNFEPAQLNAWVDRYFAPIARPDRPIPRVNVQEAPHPRAYTIYEPNTPLPAIAVTYPSPAARSPDMPALMALDAILSKGESSRLYHALVYEQQIAAEALTSLEPTQDPYVYALGAILSEGADVDQAMRSLDAEIARVRDAPVTDAELDEAKNEIVTAALKERETAFGRASTLAESVIRYRDPTYADQLLAAIQALTPADIERVARAVLDDSKRVTIRYLAEETRDAAPGRA